MKAAAYAVEMWPITRPKPYARNAKAHSEASVQKLADTIARVGMLTPIVVDTKGVIAKGHRTLLACQQLGHTSVPVHVARGVDARQLKAWRIADNVLGQDDKMDLAILPLELGDLETEGFDLSLIGFDTGELDKIMGRTNGHGPAEPGPDQWICVVTCGSERELQALYEEMVSRGLAVRMVT